MTAQTQTQTAPVQVTRTGQLITTEIERVLLTFRRFRDARTWGSDAEERARYAQLEDAINLLERRVILDRTAPGPVRAGGQTGGG